MGQRDGPRSPQLQRLGRRLKQWRKGHAPRARLPEELWAAAAALAGQEGLYRSARTLRLDYASLKRRVEAAPSRRGTGARAPRSRTAARDKSGMGPAAFVELLGGALASDCLIEVEGGGGRMRIQMKLNAPEVMSLVRDWRAATSERGGDGPL